MIKNNLDGTTKSILKSIRSHGLTNNKICFSKPIRNSKINGSKFQSCSSEGKVIDNLGLTIQSKIISTLRFVGA